jgi:hypothetical protein
LLGIGNDREDASIIHDFEIDTAATGAGTP